MKHTLLIAALSLAGLGASLNAMAADGTITFEGVVNAKTCTLDTTTSNQTVVLPAVTTTALTGVGSVAGAQPFSLKATGCDAGAVAAAVFADGNNVDPTDGNLNNTFANGTDAQIGIYRQDGTTKINLASFGDSATYTATADASNNIVLSYVAKYIAKNATTKAGLLKTNIQYTMSYQ
ncbi:fimbrial protein [Pseudomonas panipatensis]|uniref:fimbrial protein n=1 Tax=Pseudomonas panipatensis TaxID=428992 RepID=UPI0035AFB04A